MGPERRPWGAAALGCRKRLPASPGPSSRLLPHVRSAEMAAREMGGLSLTYALALCEPLANTDPPGTSAPPCAGSSVH
jgi:hypothetical protein